MTQVSGYTTRTGKRVKSYSRAGGKRVRLRTGVALDSAIKRKARQNWSGVKGGKAFSQYGYRGHLDFLQHTNTKILPKRVSRHELGSLARRARYKNDLDAQIRFLALNRERRRRGGNKSGRKSSPAIRKRKRR